MHQAARVLLIVLLCVAGLPLASAAPFAEPPLKTALQSASPAVNPAVAAFYAARDYAPAWTGPRAQAVLALLARAADQGLEPADYAVAASGPGRDVAITASLLRYMRDLSIGRPDLKALDADVQLPAQLFDAGAQLAAAVAAPDLAVFLDNLAPPHPEYAALKTALARYAHLAAQSGWPALPPGAPSDFTAGGAAEAALRHRLQYEDAALADPASDLSEGLKRFQLRHGLTADGRVGRRTLAELNVPAASRVMQIAANMERWRWLPRAFEPSVILINVPDQRLTLVLNGKTVLESPVVVGRPHDPTPILRAEGAGVTVNPPWNVPASIARREILPKLKADSSYLKSQDMVLVNGPPGDPYGLHIDWKAIPNGTFPYRIQQRPGKKNALGTIKIELPNRFDVYLHDTPAKGAFMLPDRAVSHGCVRVQQILPLASYALAANRDAMQTIASLVAAGQTKYLSLPQRLPVYFLYWTAFAGSDGALQFRPDIYGRDQRLIAALHAPGKARIAANSAGCRKG